MNNPVFCPQSFTKTLSIINRNFFKGVLIKGRFGADQKRSLISVNHFAGSFKEVLIVFKR